MYPEVWKQAKELVLFIGLAFAAGRIYERIKIAKAAVRKVQEDI